MKQKATLPIIIGSVVALVLVIFGIYKLSFAKSGIEAKAADAPEYARKMMEQQKSGAPLSPSQTSSYGQGYAESAKHRGASGASGGSMGGSMGMSGRYGGPGGYGGSGGYGSGGSMGGNSAGSMGGGGR